MVDYILIVDDLSTDTKSQTARTLGLDVIVHEMNRGYGANQKTCYEAALDGEADVIIMLYPDYQYSPQLNPATAVMLVFAPYDMVLGSRILAQSPLGGGMPLYQYGANRMLTAIENLIVGAKLSEYHTVLRGYRSTLFRNIPFQLNSDDFVFDNQAIAQALTANVRIGEVSCPTHFGHESSSISF